MSRVTGKYLWILKRAATDDWLITRLIASRDDDSEAEAAFVPTLLLPSEKLLRLTPQPTPAPAATAAAPAAARRR